MFFNISFLLSDILLSKSDIDIKKAQKNNPRANLYE